MRIALIATILAALIATPGLVASDEMPPPRTGGLYDKTMLVRNGIDDFGLTLGQFVACVDETRRQLLPADDERLRRKIRLFDTEAAGEATLIVPGKTLDFNFEFVVKEDFVFLSEVWGDGKTYSSFDEKWAIVVTVASACASL